MALLLTASPLLLPVLSSIDRRPTGYLHSWNQITTLAVIRGIQRNTLNVFYPRESVVQITWPDIKAGVAAAQTDGFTVYEEFPLYHLSAALVAATTTLPLESCARIVTLFFWALGALILFTLAENGEQHEIASITCLLYLTSFPSVYFGQAVMSDAAMVTCALAAIFFAAREQQTQSRAALGAAAALIILSSLFKSYGAITSLFLLPTLNVKKMLLPDQREKTVKRLCLSAFCLLPVIVWHLWSSFQLGDQDYLSHSILKKLALLFSPGFAGALIHAFFQYLGYPIGGGLIVWLIVKFIRQRLSADSAPGTRRGSSPGLLYPWWFSRWCACSLLYLIFIADKLSAHVYYFLLPFPALCYIAAQLIADLVDSVRVRAGAGKAGVICAVFLVAHLLLSHQQLRKACLENPDVNAVSAALKSTVGREEFTAFLSDVSRYNSIAYYADRLGFHVEQNSFPLSTYQALGAKFLVIDLDAQTYSELALWFDQQLRGKKPVWSEQVYDFKGNLRIARIFQL